MINTKLLINTSLLAVIITIVVGYSYYQARSFLTGPSVTILSPQSGASLKDMLVEINGHAKNISHIALNDRPISINEEGTFVEKLLLSPGYNIMEITAEDRFGRGTTEVLELVLIN